jgi:hypothetical protein
MTTVTIAEPSVIQTSRPRPGPGGAARYQVAPPVADGFAPWVAVLEQPLDGAEFSWITGPDGVLLPVPLGDGAAAAHPGRKAARRLTALLQR